MPHSFLIGSDGGNNRNPKHDSIQIACINFLLKYDLDFVIYIVTATNTSHTNKIEGVIPGADLFLQHQAFAKERLNDEIEELFAKATSCKKIETVSKSIKR